MNSPLSGPMNICIAGGHRETSARGADARIDHRHVDRARREAGRGGLERQGPFEDVVGGDVVRDVHDVHVAA